MADFDFSAALTATLRTYANGVAEAVDEAAEKCAKGLACVLLSCASHPVEVTASVDIYPSRIVTSILFSRFL